MVEESPKERVLSRLHEFVKVHELDRRGNIIREVRTCSTSDFREMLFQEIPGLEPEFLLTQQDAGEILIKIFHDLLPEKFLEKHSIMSGNWKRCNDSTCTVSEI